MASLIGHLIEIAIFCVSIKPSEYMGEQMLKRIGDTVKYNKCF